MTSWLEWDNCKETAPGSPLKQVRKKYCVSRWSHDQDHDELKCNPEVPLNETRSCEEPGNFEVWDGRFLISPGRIQFAQFAQHFLIANTYYLI